MNTFRIIAIKGGVQNATHFANGDLTVVPTRDDVRYSVVEYAEGG